MQDEHGLQVRSAGVGDEGHVACAGDDAQRYQRLQRKGQRNQTRRRVAEQVDAF